MYLSRKFHFILLDKKAFKIVFFIFTILCINVYKYSSCLSDYLKMAKKKECKIYGRTFFYPLEIEKRRPALVLAN